MPYGIIGKNWYENSVTIICFKLIYTYIIITKLLNYYITNSKGNKIRVSCDTLATFL